MFHPSVTHHRLFFALRPDAILARRIALFAAGLPCRPLAPERLHVTLFILDDLPSPDPAVAAALATIGGTVAAAPFEVTLDRLVASGRSAALRPGRTNRPLLALYDRLAGLAAAAGIAGRRGHRFAPHLTLGYGEAAPRSERVAPVGWVADELVLIASHLGRTHHELLGRWPLAGPGDETAQLALL